MSAVLSLVVAQQKPQDVPIDVGQLVLLTSLVPVAHLCSKLGWMEVCGSTCCDDALSSAAVSS